MLKQCSVAKALADSSVIKTDAILAREAIKNQNMRDKVQVNMNFLLMHRN
jgi:hypothetical protein